MRVALIVMPWSAPEFSPVGVSVLKRYLEDRGVAVDLHLFHLRMLERAGPTACSVLQGPLGEWLFAEALFGRQGLGEMRLDPAHLASRPDFRGLLEAAGRRRVGRERLARIRRGIPRFLEDCLGAARWGRYGLVGFSSVFHNQLASLALARLIKARHPRVPIAFGGANVLGEMGAALLRGFEWVDFVVDGDGERPLLELLRRLESGAAPDVPGVSRREGGRLRLHPGTAPPIPMAEVPSPDYGGYLRALAALRLPRRQRDALSQAVRYFFEASRGCWWGEKRHCVFCGLNGDQMAFRRKPPERVVEEILEIHRSCRTTRLNATDNILDMEAFRTLLPRLAEVQETEGIRLDLFFEVKTNLDAAQVDLLARAGVSRVQGGIESLDTGILRRMLKGVSAIQNLRFLRLCAERGIAVSWNFLYGFLGEPPRAYARMLRLMPRIVHLQPPEGASLALADRFSPYFTGAGGAPAPGLRPLSHYAFLYPASRVPLSGIAWHFDFDRGDLGYAAPCLRYLQRWRGWEGTAFLAYERGRGYLTVYDYRPASPRSSALRFRVHRLQGLEAELLLGSTDMASVEGLAARSGAAAGAVGRALGRLDRLGLVFREGPRVLQLAVPLPARGELARRVERQLLFEGMAAS